MKLATFSLDDGGPADFAVADLFRSHGLVPTFYIASSLLNMDEMIVQRSQLAELNQWIERLLAPGYTIIPNSTYFERTFKS